jgi:hypothetical protein
MAAPTNPRVESNSISSAIIRWTYGGSNPIVVYRADHGGSFSALNADSPVLVGTTEYLDITAVASSFYDYKLSDDGGSTFSSTVSVVIQTCPSTSSSNQLTSTVALPQFTKPTDINVDNMVNMAAQIEASQNTDQVGDSCPACITDGAVVFDCATGCFNFEVDVTEDVNSITVNQCEGGKGGTITWNFPPNTTRKVCGWPAGMGFIGDECFNNPIVSGSTGRSMRTGYGKGRASSSASKKGYGKGAGGAAGKGGTACACKTDGNNKLTIKSCNDNNSLNCTSTKSLDLIACGGKGPYTWSKTGSITLTRTTGDKVTVRPPTNSGSGVAGDAYAVIKRNCYWFGAGFGNCGPGGGSSIINNFSWAVFGCNDQVTVACQNTDDSGGDYATCNGGRPATLECITGSCSSACTSGCGSGFLTYKSGFSPCDNSPTLKGGTVCDKRSGAMVSAGCNPCGLQSGSTVTVTDSLGVSVTIILRA